MICPVVSKEHFRSMRITLAFSVIALSFCIAFAVLTFAGILAQYTALCAAFFALVFKRTFPALPFQPRYFPAQARTYGI